MFALISMRTQLFLKTGFVLEIMVRGSVEYCENIRNYFSEYYWLPLVHQKSFYH